MGIICNRLVPNTMIGDDMAKANYFTPMPSSLTHLRSKEKARPLGNRESGLMWVVDGVTCSPRYVV